MLPATPSSVPSLLLVDDEPVVLAALRETLERENYHVVATTSPLKALEILRQQDFAVIISDQRMPEMLGLDFLVESRRLRPQASRILITAVLSLPTIVDAINRGEIFRFIAKPWLREELTTTVKNALQRHELITRNEQLHREAARLNQELTAANRELAAQVQALESRQQALDAANRELAATYERSLDLCSRILTTYDPFLGGQTKAMAAIAQKMAESPHLQTQDKHLLCTAAWLCDLGLIGVSRELLRSFRAYPERLTERERRTLESHPIYSQTLASFVDGREGLGETIRAHHEHFDGSGYPDGRAGRSIPWPARCLAVAVWYVESGISPEHAPAAIRAQAGKALDPAAVELFLQTLPSLQLPRQVRELFVDELQPGMVLANGLYSPHGLLLISEGQPLTGPVIAKIKNHHHLDPIQQRLLVYS